MSDPHRREVRPSRPYGGEPGGSPRGRDTRGPDPRPVARQPTFTPRPDAASQRAADRSGTPRGRGAEAHSREPSGRLSWIWHGSLHGGLGICVIVGSAVIGAIATIVTKAQPGMALDLAVLAGTVAAALTVQPRTGRLIFPVPALSYLVAALAAGVAYNRSLDKTALAVGATQWIADGFFVMVLATLLAVALTTVRWFMWRRGRRGPDGSVQSGRSAGRPGPSAGRPGPSTGPLRQPGARRGAQPVQWPPPGSAERWDQRPGPRPDQRPGPRSGVGPYNFSSGA